MKKALFLFFLLPLTAAGQRQVSTYPFHSTADSIVSHLLGHDILQSYVKLDKSKSGYLQQKPRGRTKVIRFTRQADLAKRYFYHYRFSHPKLAPHKFIISFTLDSLGNFIPGDHTHGIIRVAINNDSIIVSKNRAIKVIGDNSFSFRRRSLQLVWDTTNLSYEVFQKTQNFRDIEPGDLVWQARGKVMFREELYSGRFHLNVFTGSLAKLFAIPWD